MGQKSLNMDRTQREAVILEQLSRKGSLVVSNLARELGTSEVTIRATLQSLEDRGLLTRTHGGAVPSSIHNVLARAERHSDTKQRIAEAAASLVRDNDRIMIEAGTTTSAIPRYLVGHTGVQIVTNSTLVFNQARINPQLEVIMTGGTFHRASESLVGPIAQRAIRDFNVRLAFVGTDGFTPERGITTQFAEGAEIIRAMHERAEQTWLLTDSSKFAQSGFVSVLELRELSGIITDQKLSTKALKSLRETVREVRAV